jgi:hypothetical protein
MRFVTEDGVVAVVTAPLQRILSFTSLQVSWFGIWRQKSRLILNF